MRYSYWICVLGIALGICGELPAQTAMPDDSSIWSYVTFDKSVDAIVPTSGFRHIKVDGEPQFGPGLVGQALRVREGDAVVDLIIGRDDFPTDRGSVVLWFKPESPLGKASRWLIDGRWANYSISIEGSRMIAYAVGEPRQLVAGDLKDLAATWIDRWHQVVMTWQDGAVRLYVDGQRLAQRDNCAPFEVPFHLAMGHRPANRNSPTPTSILNGWLDEFAVLSTALTAEQVAELYRQGTAEGYRGLLTSLGGTLLVQMKRHAFLQGEPAHITVLPMASSGDAIHLSAIAPDGNAIPLADLPCRTATVTLDTTDFRPGRYRLRCELRKDGVAMHTDETGRLAVRRRQRPAFPVGLDALRHYGDDMLERAEQWHLTHTSHGGFYSFDGLYKDVDRLFYYGLEFFPNLNIHFHVPLPFPGDGWFDPQTGKATQKMHDEVFQVMVEHGDTSLTPVTTSLCSPFSPIARDTMKQRIRDLLNIVDGHPGLQYISFNDEYSHRIGLNRETGVRYYGDYSASAVDYFKQQTGIDHAVFPPDAEPGTVFPDDLTYFKWRDVIGMPGDYTNAGLSMNAAEMTELIHELRPDIQTTSWSGCEYGACDAVMDYHYPTIWQPAPGYFQGFGRLDYIFDRHRVRQRVTPIKPVWGLLGWWSDDLRGKPDWCVQDLRLNTIMALAKGAKLITWFTAWGTQNEADQFGRGILSREDLRDEMIQWADWIHRFGPMFAQLETRPSRRIAVLYSEDNRVGTIVQQNNPTDFNWFYPCLRIAGVDVDVITDEHVKDGRLNDYEALVLCAFDYASQTLWDRIQHFAATQGKTVFVDDATALVPDGAISIGFKATDTASLAGRRWTMDVVNDTYDMFVPKLREKVVSNVRPGSLAVTGSNFVAPHWLYGGDARLLCLVNYHVFQPQTIDVALQASGVLYNLETGYIIAQGSDMRWQKTLPKGEAAWYLLLPHKIGQIEASLSVRDEQFHVKTSIEDSEGRSLKAAIPVQIRLIDPSGEDVSAYERYLATDPRTGDATLTFPVATRMDQKGTWRAVVTELVTGRNAAATTRFESTQ